ncbi:hypothetical protein Q4555_14145 [Octadecabacter sp. 1_MG-2023]|uniref:DUF6636 domain-containing protein n=1 Tax=unclassified Octadecabacter TaxID=196158 RepID=UPI001C09C46C|nr:MULTISPECIES: DUF6636 domain-containing protein [unclassified Octadecabacter]MBU2991841.1 hypothetical protein [Octadecabacter sp. B2R22]MDO6735815.1 hypothetical protein [Octadecabacter sp. 1_MG-2023]
MTRKTKPFARTLRALSTVALMLLVSPVWALGFASPSGNIKCYVETYGEDSIIEADLVCLIFDAAWDLPPDYGDGDPTCDLDETRTLVLPTSGQPEERWTCHGDVFWPAPLATISYGSEWSFYSYTCAMAASGVSCENRNGNGFSVNRAGRTLN